MDKPKIILSELLEDVDKFPFLILASDGEHYSINRLLKHLATQYAEAFELLKFYIPIVKSTCNMGGMGEKWLKYNESIVDFDLGKSEEKE